MAYIYSSQQPPPPLSAPPCQIMEKMGMCCVKERRELEQVIQNSLAKRPRSGETHNTEALATFGGGRFWCLEAAFKEIKGVSKVVPGYMGGIVENPKYEDVMAGNTGHAFVVQITYDDNVTLYSDLVHLFLRLHNPTQMNKQGDDVGFQFRSVIFHHNEQQWRIASLIKINLNQTKLFQDPIVTQIVPAMTFFPAELEQQDFFKKHPQDEYCLNHIAPRLDKMRVQFRSNIVSEEEERKKALQEVVAATAAALTRNVKELKEPVAGPSGINVKGKKIRSKETMYSINPRYS